MSISDRTPAEQRVEDAGCEFIGALNALAVEDRCQAIDAAAEMWRKLGDELGVDG